MSSIVISSAAVRGKLAVGELARVRSDPRFRAESELDKQRSREALIRELARFEKHWYAMPEFQLNRDVADGRDLILKMIAIARKNLERGASPWWNQEINAIRQQHEIFSLALAADTRRGLKTLESARKGHRGRYGSAAEKREKYQPVVDKIASSNPHLSRREINRRAGQELGGVSYKAVERHTTDPRKKKK
jgi:hypothetical protein